MGGKWKPETEAQKSVRRRRRIAARETDNAKARARRKSDPVWRESRQREARERRRKLTTNDKGRINERQCARRALPHARELRSSWQDILEHASVITTHELRFGHYIVQSPGHRREHELWPIDDAAAKWIEQHEAEQKQKAIVLRHHSCESAAVSSVPRERPRLRMLAACSGPADESSRGSLRA